MDNHKPNLAVKNTWIKGSDRSKCDSPEAQKIKRAHRIKLHITQISKIDSYMPKPEEEKIVHDFMCSQQIDSIDLFVNLKFYSKQNKIKWIA